MKSQMISFISFIIHPAVINMITLEFFLLQVPSIVILWMDYAKENEHQDGWLTFKSVIVFLEVLGETGKFFIMFIVT